MRQLESFLFCFVLFVIAGYLVLLAKRKAREIRDLSHRREFDRYVLWNLMFPLAAPFRLRWTFTFPHDRENPAVVEALEKARPFGLAALISSVLFLISFLGFLLTVFVGPPGLRRDQTISEVLNIPIKAPLCENFECDMAYIDPNIFSTRCTFCP